MNKTVALIAWRYFWDTRAEKSISTMLIICFAGIFIGSFALALIASVMSGFEKVTHEKLQGIHAQIIMRASGNELHAAKIQAILGQEFPEIAAYSPATYKQVILQKETDTDISNAILLKIVDPFLEQKTSTIGTKIKTEQTLVTLIDSDTILLGDKIAHNLNVAVGDTINFLFVPEKNTRSSKISLEQAPAIVGGIFSTGIEEFDTGLALISFAFAQKLFGHVGIEQFNIQLKNSANEQATIQKLKNRFNLEVFSWKDLYPALVSALKLEKYVMFFIFSLIVLVASMSILSLMYMHIIKKRVDIALYKSMGMSNRLIITLFTSIGISVSCLATFCGLIAAAITGIFLQKYPFITLPDSYYVSHLPVHLEWQTFALVFILVLCMSIIATLIPCTSIRSINIAKILRFEG